MNGLSSVVAEDTLPKSSDKSQEQDIIVKACQSLSPAILVDSHSCLLLKVFKHTEGNRNSWNNFEILGDNALVEACQPLSCINCLHHA